MSLGLQEDGPGTAAPRTLAERAFAQLHRAILSGALTPGQRLPIEEVAADLSMSPMPVREALRRLHEAGLVDNVPHRGATVAELSLADLREIYDARLALEPIAVRLAAARFEPEHAERARRALDGHVAAYRRGSAREAFDWHTAFHFAFYEAAGSRWLLRLIQPLWESSERYRIAVPPGYRRRLQERLAEHERILAACVARDGEAAAAEMRDHLVVTANRIAARMGSEALFAR